MGLDHAHTALIRNGHCRNLFWEPGKTTEGCITVQLTSCLTYLDWSVLQIKMKIVSCHTADSKPVKQEVNSIMILPPLVFLCCQNKLRQWPLQISAVCAWSGPNVTKLFLSINYKVTKLVCLSPGKLFKPNLMIVSKAGASPSGISFRLFPSGRLPTNIRFGLESLPGTNTLAYYENS